MKNIVRFTSVALALLFAGVALAPAFAAQGPSASASSGKQTPTPGPTDSDIGPDAEAVLARTDELNQAFVHADVATLERIIADDCLQITQNGTRMKAEWLAPYRSGTSHFESVKPPEWRRIRLYGDVAVVTAAAEIVMVAQGERRPSRFFNTRTWVKRSGQWYLVLAQNTPRATAESRVSAEQEIRKLEEERRQAVLHNDTKTLDQIYADDMTIIDIDGNNHTNSKKASVNLNLPGTRTTKSWVSDEMLVRVYGDIAVVTQRAQIEDLLRGQSRSFSARLTHVWARLDGRWRLVARHATRTVEGQQSAETVSGANEAAESRTFDGVWKLNAAKSDFGEGPRWKSRMLWIESYGDTRKYQSESVNEDGTKTLGHNEAQYDGKDHPVPGSPDRTIAVKRVDSRTFENTFKRNGEVYEVNRSVLSEDGTVMTTARKAANSQGKWYSAVYVYEKQGNPVYEQQLVARHGTEIAEPETHGRARPGPSSTKTPPPHGEETSESRAQSQADQEVLAVEEQMETLQRSDNETRIALWAEDLIYVGNNGVAHDKSSLARAVSAGEVKTEFLDVTDRKVRTYGDTAVVTAIEHRKAGFHGREVRDLVLRYTRVWVRRNDKWQVVSFQETRITAP